MVQKPTLIVDTREKQPWCFEGDDAFEEVLHQKLDVGDYSIDGMQDIIVIERKAGVDELYANFSKKSKREQVFAEFECARHCHAKILMIECTYDDVMNSSAYYVNQPHPKTGRRINKRNPKMPIAVVNSNLIKLILEYNVQVVFGGMRAQAIARGILLQAYDLHRKGKLIESH